MPRLSKSEQQKRDDNFREVISGRLEQVHITRTELGKKIGLAPSTMTRRWECPDDFSKKELRGICSILNIGCERLINADTL